jgi:hypothetical protein
VEGGGWAVERKVGGGTNQIFKAQFALISGLNRKNSIEKLIIQNQDTKSDS